MRATAKSTTRKATAITLAAALVVAVYLTGNIPALESA